MKNTTTVELEYTPEELDNIVISEVRAIVNHEVKSKTETLIKEAIQETILTKVQEWIDLSLQNYRFETKENHQIVPITITEHMQRLFVLFMNEKVDQWGKTSYDGKSRISHLLNQQMEDVYTRVIRPQVQKATADLKSQMNDKLHQEVATKMKEILFSSK